MKRIVFICLSLLSPLLLAGCWDRHEMNQLSIVVGMSIDKVGKEYSVTVQIVNPGQIAVKTSTGGVSPVLTYQEKGVTVPDAIGRMSTKTPRRLYFAHLRMIVFGEDVAREGIGKTLDFVSRNMEMRTDFYLVVARNTSGEQILRTNTGMDPIPSNNMYTKLETSDKLWAATGKMTIHQLLEQIGTEGKMPAMTGLEIIGNKKKGEIALDIHAIHPAATLKYSGMAVFRKDKMIGWLDEEDVKALNYVQNSVEKTRGFIPCPQGEGNISVEVTRARSRIDMTLRDERPEFDVYVWSEQDVAAVECGIDMTKLATAEDIKKQADEKIKGFLEKSIRKVQQQYGTDIYGFGSVVHRTNPKLWHKISENWNDIFRNVVVRIHTDAQIRRIGTTLQSVSHETER